MICGCRGTTALQPSCCRAVALRQPHFVYVLLMCFAPLGLCSEFVFCLAGVALHFTPAYYPPSLRDLGCGTKEPQRGERILSRRWSMAEPLPMKTTLTNPKNKNAPMLSNLFIFAGRKHLHYVYLQYKFKRCAC